MNFLLFCAFNCNLRPLVIQLTTTTLLLLLTWLQAKLAKNSDFALAPLVPISFTKDIIQTPPPTTSTDTILQCDVSSTSITLTKSLSEQSSPFGDQHCSSQCVFQMATQASNLEISKFQIVEVSNSPVHSSSTSHNLSPVKSSTMDGDYKDSSRVHRKRLISLPYLRLFHLRLRYKMTIFRSNSKYIIPSYHRIFKKLSKTVRISSNLFGMN